MKDDDGIYILVTPTRDTHKTEFRVVHLRSSNDITLTINSGFTSMNPVAVRPYFADSPVFTDEYAARAATDRMLSAGHATDRPVYHIYINTPFPKWERKRNGDHKKKQG